MVCIFGFRLSGLFEYFCQSEQKSEKRSIRTANSLNKTRWRFFVDYLQPFTPCWKNLIKKIQKQGKTSWKWMTCSFSCCLRSIGKLTEMLQIRTDAYVVEKKLNAVYRLSWENFQLLRFILNIKDFWRSAAVFKNLGWLENDNGSFFIFWTAMLIASVHHVIGIQSDIPTRAFQVRREIVPIVVLDLFCPWWNTKLYVDRKIRI